MPIKGWHETHMPSLLSLLSPLLLIVFLSYSVNVLVTINKLKFYFIYLKFEKKLKQKIAKDCQRCILGCPRILPGWARTAQGSHHF
jgi:hypothetical protein